MLDVIYGSRPLSFPESEAGFAGGSQPALCDAALAAAAASGFAMIAEAFGLSGQSAERKLSLALRGEPLLARVDIEDALRAYRGMSADWAVDPDFAEASAAEQLAILRTDPATAAAVVRMALKAAPDGVRPVLMQVRAIARLQLAAGVKTSAR
ncbi:MAG: hypothetical protein FJX29_03010 [Alphaproteobacteria bacterium]|nr:hypothetical protein [Alphaproteobacteria bacterium]